MKRDPKDVVREGYDKIATQYLESLDSFNNDAELIEFMSLVQPGGRILDAGCGPGEAAQILVNNGFQVVGIDISQKMIELAEQRVPEAEFKVGDMTALDLKDGAFDGIVSTYAVFHVPRNNHFGLFKDFHRLLKKGGPLLISIGTTETDGVWTWEEFQAVPMFWSYHPPPKTVKFLESAGFEIVFTRNVEIMFAGEVETHHWILAKAL
jgi:ubiquinone/menaquinone biosynthesis C-methylase UbiE